MADKQRAQQSHEEAVLELAQVSSLQSLLGGRRGAVRAGLCGVPPRLPAPAADAG